MNLFIVGGLLIVGVLAVIAIVLIVRGEPGTSASTPSPKPSQRSEPPIDTAASGPSLAVQAAPVPEKEAQPKDLQTKEWSPLATGQFYELANELRTLHQQSQEFEQRLSTLRDMVERVDYAQHDHTTNAEDVQHLSDVPSAN